MAARSRPKYLNYIAETHFQAEVYEHSDLVELAGRHR